MRILQALPLLLLIFLIPVACSEDGGSEAEPPQDTGQPDLDAGEPEVPPEDVKEEEVNQCPPEPVVRNCPQGKKPVDSDEVDENDCPIYYVCEPCPVVQPPQCQAGQRQAMDQWGCPTDQCECRIQAPPQCPAGQEPRRAGECYTGACGPVCPPVQEPTCSIHQQAEVDENGCFTGRCVDIPCGITEPPTCEMHHRPARLENGCFTGQCQPELPACPPLELPECEPGEVPTVGQRCLTGDCLVGECISRCHNDTQCSSSDACIEYSAGCTTCYPRGCDERHPCPQRTDCIDGHCILRATCDCSEEEPCEEEGLICDDAVCGRCIEPCQCEQDEDCVQGYRCDACRCVEGCRTDEECGVAAGCNPLSGLCQACDCSVDDDCALNFYCRNQCLCLGGCRDHDDCSPIEGCFEHRCEPICNCQRHDQCGLGHRCVECQCVPDPGVCPDNVDERCRYFFSHCFCGYECVPASQYPPEDCARDCPGEPGEPPTCRCSEGTRCSIVQCGGEEMEPCPPGYHCSLADPNDPFSMGACREGWPIERFMCREDMDCVPEDCCQPVRCVNLHDVHCDIDMCCEPGEGCEEPACFPELQGCACVDGLCKASHGEPPVCE